MPRRRRRRGSGGEVWKIALGVLLGIVALAALGGIVWLGQTVERPPRLDTATLCPTDGPRAVTVVLLDGSDALPDVGQRQVATALIDTAEALPDYALLEVRLLDAADAGGEVLFHRCNPGDGSGLDEWTGNPEAARRRWLAEFRGPIEQVLRSGIPAAPADTSPIMAAIQRIAVDHFEGKAKEAIPKSLVLVSDMIENTADYSQYSGDVAYERFEGSAAAKRFRTDLHGAEVTVYYVDRASGRPFDSVAHLGFWTDWIAGCGGRLVEAVKLQGAG